MPVTVTLPGPAPWGFRISGGRDFGKPITVSKVTEHGKAAAGDLRAGDVIVTINGESTAEMLHVEAQNKIKQSPGQLRLEVERSLMPPPSHANGDTSLERLATRVQVSPSTPCPPTQGWWQLLVSPSPPQDTLRTRDESQGALRAPDPSLASPIHLPHSASSQPLEEEFTCPGLCQERGILTHQNSCQGSILPPPPCPPSPGFGAPQNPWETHRERRPSLSPNTCNRHLPLGVPSHSQGSEPAMRRLEEDSEVYKMLQENRELRAAPRQSSTFRLLQEALEDEGGGGPTAPFPSRLSSSARKPVAGVQKLHVCEKCGSSIATQAVRIQDGRYRHPSCYSCADCGLNLKMRGHFWVGDELFCEKHARLRYQGPPGAPVSPPPVSPHS
ncbi:PDZ and LIM domain protein 2 isoform X1 [Pipra filicauda]|uniref:PDZ and LIM domain protein 2 n=1 Tax=Pipra filicauda TaxID=649802 RepID=A0A7R5L1E9_9PASS|nr:PDZ and LIM domain protein 2 isoform X1 [Pipra filicauda]